MGLIVNNRGSINEFCKKYKINIKHSLCVDFSVGYTEVLCLPRETWQKSRVSPTRTFLGGKPCLIRWEIHTGDNLLLGCDYQPESLIGQFKEMQWPAWPVWPIDFTSLSSVTNGAYVNLCVFSAQSTNGVLSTKFKWFNNLLALKPF